jgi:hypothetical protein
MESSTILLLIFGVLALASAMSILWLSRLRAARRWQGERRLQVLLDAFAEREIARERLRNAAHRIRKSSPHGTILQDLSLRARPIAASRNGTEAQRNLGSLRLGASLERE